MINKDRYLDWFKAFCVSFYEGLERHDGNYRLKEEHTQRVCENVSLITLSEDTTNELAELAWLCGLFHDLGRFPQYRQYRTFKDSESLNHGLLSAQIVQDSDILEALTPPQRDAITVALKFHNAYQIPPGIETAEDLFCLKVLRDADKLDIWNTFIDYYTKNLTKRPSAMGLGLPDVPTYTRALIDEILQEKMLKLADVKTLNDFKLLQLSWLFDLNFRESYRLFSQRGYLQIMRYSLPQTEDIHRLLGFLEAFLSRHI